METMRPGGSAPEFPLFGIIISLEHIMNQNDLVCGCQVLQNLHMVFWLMVAQTLFGFLIVLSADQPDFYVIHC